MIPQPVQFPQQRPQPGTPQQFIQQPQAFIQQTQFQQQMQPRPVQMIMTQGGQIFDPSMQQFLQQPQQQQSQMNQIRQQQQQFQTFQQVQTSIPPQQMQQFQAIDPALLLQYPNIKQELDTLSNEFGLTGDFGLTDDALRQVNGNSLDIPVNLMSPLSTSPHDPTEYPEANDDMMKGGSNGSLNSPFVSSTPIDVKNRQVQNISNGSNTPKMIPGSNNPGFYSMSMPVNSGFGVSASSFGSFGSPSGFGDLPLDDRQFDALVSEMGDARLEIMNERRRRRRESHNAVERRRRDNINEKIQELATLLPDLANDTQNKPNKGVILRRSVDYIRYIQSYTLKLEQRQRELEGAIGRLVPKGRENELGLSFVLGSPIDLVPYYTPGQAPQNTPPPASIQQQQQYQLEQMQFQQFQQQQQQVAQQQMQNQAGMQ